MALRSTLRPIALATAAAAALCATPAHAARTLQDYRYFRALSIDLTGDVPTPEDLAAFEADGFDLDAWVDAHLTGPGYADHLTEIYMDLLRLDIGRSFEFNTYATSLYRVRILGPNGQPMNVYFRNVQQRGRAGTSGQFCLTESDVGFVPSTNDADHIPASAHAVDQATLDANTVLVKPWWLYRDYRSANPTDRYDPATWGATNPGYWPDDSLLTEPDGTTPVTAVRVCREEAQTAATGPSADGAHTYSCQNATGASTSTGCGCGPGLEWCWPNGDFFGAMDFTSVAPLGIDQNGVWPFDRTPMQKATWIRFWWGQEAAHIFRYTFDQDRDFREVLTSQGTVINGPLAWFYRSTAQSRCCAGPVGGAAGLLSSFGLNEPVPLFDPNAIPADLLPHDVARWVPVDRGPLAAGLLTTTVFLTKYGTRRARAHALYNTFLCRDFIAPSVELPPSSEPNLMIRPGCSSCHATLEPLAAYFTRVMENEWTYLPPQQFPIHLDRCHNVPDGGYQPYECPFYYDPAFGDDASGMLRGAYGSPAHADMGPRGAAAEIAGDPAFAGCVVSNIAQSLLGRPLGVEDAPLRDQLTQTFVSGGYRVRPLVRALLHSSVYRDANNLTGTAWRTQGSP